MSKFGDHGTMYSTLRAEWYELGVSTAIVLTRLANSPPLLRSVLIVSVRNVN